MHCLLGGRVLLHDTEDVSFSILTVGHVAYTWNRALRHDDFAACLFDSFGELVDARYGGRVDGGSFLHSGRYCAVDAGLVIWACRGKPVLNRSPPVDLPAEHLLVELHCTLRIVGAYLEMNYSRHSRFFFGLV